MKNSHVSFYRTAYFTAKCLLAHESIVCLAGPKESGKTTIMLQLKDKFDGKYIPLKQMTVEHAESAFAQVMQSIEDNEPEMFYLDDIMYLPNLDGKLDSIYAILQKLELAEEQPKFKLIVSGSKDKEMTSIIDKTLDDYAAVVHVPYFITISSERACDMFVN